MISLKDEIKEILDSPIFIIDNEGFTVYINDKINNYITNLQEENENLKKQLNCKEIYSNYMPKDTEFIIMSKADYERQELDYKSRCEKAIPMLKKLNIKLKDILKIGIDIKEISDIENILNGGNEE